MAKTCRSCIRYKNGICKHYKLEISKDMIACKEHYMTKEQQIILGQQISAKRKRKRAKREQNAESNTSNT